MQSKQESKKTPLNIAVWNIRMLIDQDDTERDLIDEPF